MTAKELSSRGYNVLFLDRDLFSYASELAGVKRSYLAQIAKGEEPKDFYVDIGNLTIVKLIGEGILFIKDIDEIHKDEKKKELAERSYEKLVKRKNYDFFIIDNPPYVTMESEVVKHEVTMFEKLFPNEKIYRVYVTTPLFEDVKITKEYYKELESEAPGEALGIIVNMAVDMKKGIEALSQFQDMFKIRVVVPFYDELYQFCECIEKFSVIKEVKEMVDAILKGEEKTIYHL